MKTIISMPGYAFRKIKSLLLPPRMRVEEVCFLFAQVKKNNNEIYFMVREWHHVQSSEYAIQSESHVALLDEMRPKIIKRAHDLDATVVELHSHIGNNSAQFSSSDMYGFQEFVPHVRWRLNNKPYAAVVFTQSGFDALVWTGNQNMPTSLTEIQQRWLFWKQRHHPNRLTLGRKNSHYA